MMISPPKIEEIKEFQFKLHSRLRIFHSAADVNLFNRNVNILSACSRYGLLFAGHPSGFRVIPTSSLQVSGSVEQKKYEHSNIDLPSQPSFLAVNADQTCLAVVIATDSGSAAVIYDLQSLTTQQIAVKYQLRLTQDPSITVQDLQWNPAIPNLISFIFSDGSVLLYELKGGPFTFFSLPQSALANCHSWSPKGKQIVIGSTNGTLTQHKPDLKPVKTIGAPSFIQNPSVVNVHWLSSFQFCAVYRDTANPEERPCIVIVNTPKSEPIQYINYEDICFSMGTVRPPQYYIIHQQVWNVLLVSSANSGEVGVLAADSKNWVPWTQIDEGRAELPADPATKNETYPVGFTLDVSSAQPVPWGMENQVIPPMPILAILSHSGVLCLFHVVNLLPSFVPICSPPEPLADKSALQLASISSLESNEPPEVHGFTDAQVSPEKQTPLINESLNLTTAAPFTPQQNELFSFSTPTKSESVTKKLDFSFNQNNSSAVDGQMKPSDISGVNLMLEKTTTSSVPSFAPVSSDVEPEKRSAKAVKSAANLEMYTSAVYDEIAQFETELKDFKNSASNLDITVGLEEEKNELKKNVDSLDNFYKELTETTSSLNLEVDSLKTILMEAFSWIEDSKARKMQLHHPGYQNVVRLQELDPVSLRRLNNIQSNVYYVESQLQQANAQLESLWADLQDSFAHNKKNMKIPLLENVYQAMVVQKNIFNKLHTLIDVLSSKVKVLQNDKPFISASNMSESINGDSELSKLAESLIKVKLNQAGKSGNLCLEAKRHLVLLARKQILNAVKEAKLKELQSIHTPNRVKPAKLKMTNGSFFGSCNVLPLSTTCETMVNIENPVIKTSEKSASQLTSTVPAKGVLSSTSDVSFKQIPRDLSSFANSQSVNKSNTQNGVFSNTPVEKEKAVSSTDFSFGKSDTVPGFTTKVVSSVPESTQFRFRNLATSNSPQIVSTSASSVKSISSGQGVSLATKDAQNISVKFSSSLETQLGTSVPTKSNLFGSENTSISPFAPDESFAKDKSTTKATNSVGEISFGSLGFGDSVTATKSPSVSIFGGSVAPKTSMFGGKPTSESVMKSEAAPAGATTPFAPLNTTALNVEGFKATAVTSPASDSSPSLQVNYSSSTTGVSDPKTSSFGSKWNSQTTSVGLATTVNTSAVSSAVSFSFGDATKAVSSASATSSSSEAVKSNTTNSSWSFAPVSTSQAVSSSNTAAATLSIPPTSAFSFGSTGKAASVSIAPLTSANSPFSATNLSVNSSTVSTSVTPSSVFSFSSAQTFAGSEPSVVTFAETKPAFSFGQALTTSNAQSPFNTFSFGNLKPQVSIFGGQSPAKTPTSSATSDSSVSSVSATVTTVTPTTTSTSATDSANNLFGNLSVSSTSKPSIFGNAPVATSTTTTAVFGSSIAATTSCSIFGAPASTAEPSLFATPATTTLGSSLFRTPTTTTATSSLFGSPSAQPVGTSVFGQASSVASTAPQSPSLFATPVQVTTAAFGLATTSASVSKPSLFSNSSSSLFGTPASGTSTSLFESSNAVTTAAANVSLFGSPATTASVSNSSFFGQAICSPNPTVANVFGQSPPLFGQAAAAGSPGFGGSPSFGGKSTFGQSGGSLFGNSANSFGQSTGTSVFGSPSGPSVLGANTATSPVFGQSAGANTSGGIFGGSSFSAGLNQSSPQSGFGASASFQNKPASGFGAPPTFGAAPSFSSTSAFGSPPAFGSAPSMFGSTSPTSAFGGGLPNQSSPTNPTFENLAKQNTVSFGNLAQNQAPSGFGNANLFGGSPQAANTFQKQPTSPQFGGSSFSSWR